MDLKKLITELSALMSITGYEDRNSEKIKEFAKEYFDEYFCDNLRNQILVKK